MTYEELAQEFVTQSHKKVPTLLVSYAGGRSRYVKLRREEDDAIVATLFSTDIATFFEDGRIRLDSGGYRTREHA